MMNDKTKAPVFLALGLLALSTVELEREAYKLVGSLLTAIQARYIKTTNVNVHFYSNFLALHEKTIAQY